MFFLQKHIIIRGTWFWLGPIELSTIFHILSQIYPKDFLWRLSVTRKTCYSYLPQVETGFVQISSRFQVCHCYIASTTPRRIYYRSSTAATRTVGALWRATRNLCGDSWATPGEHVRGRKKVTDGTNLWGDRHRLTSFAIASQGECQTPWSPRK